MFLYSVVDLPFFESKLDVTVRMASAHLVRNAHSIMDGFCKLLFLTIGGQTKRNLSAFYAAHVPKSESNIKHVAT